MGVSLSSIHLHQIVSTSVEDRVIHDASTGPDGRPVRMFTLIDVNGARHSITAYARDELADEVYARVEARKNFAQLLAELNLTEALEERHPCL